MKQNFGSFVKKESLHILRDKRTILVVMLIPVMLMILFGFAISTEVNNINVAVVASERTDGVRDAVERLSQNEYFTFKGYISQDDIDPYLRSGKAGAVVVFASDYDRRAAQAAAGVATKPIVQLIVDASNVNTAGSATAYLQNILLGYGLSAKYPARLGIAAGDVRNTNVVQPADEVGIQLRAWHYGTYLHPCLCDDDLGVDCAREGGWYDGGATCLARATREDYLCQDDSLLRHLVRCVGNYPTSGALPARGADVGRCRGALLAIIALPYAVALARTFGFNYRLDADGSVAYLGNGYDDAYPDAVWNVISD